MDAMSEGGVCRLCGRPDADSDTTAEPRLLVLVARYLQIEIDREDGLPQDICFECDETVTQFHRFAERCLTVQDELISVNVNAPEMQIKIELDIKPEELGDDTETDPGPGIKQESDTDPISSGSYWDDDFDCTMDSSDKQPVDEGLKIKKKKSLSSEKQLDKRTDLLKQYITFSCFVCEETHPNWFRLKAHIVQAHGEVPKVKCSCGCVVKSKTAIYRHVAAHNDPTMYACNQCSRMTKTQEALDKHMKRHLEKKNPIFTCSVCAKVFNTKECLKSHERVHIPLVERYNYPCNICGNKFTTKSAVTGHIRAVHDKLKRFICDVCGYACSTGGELVQHQAIHSDDKLFECATCSKRFKTSSNLKAHLDTHANTSYTCAVCGKVLNSRRTLRKHYLVHDDLCRHKCTFCNRAFKRRQTLKVHLTTHTGAKPIQCPYCPEKFAYSSSFRMHKKKQHGNEPIDIVPKVEIKELKFD